ncbi:MAG: patatin-like phospholipase family protein [Firmicutes bacterium]|nr:patatin-like phospholipase family protein [Bacillota bacterium]
MFSKTKEKEIKEVKKVVTKVKAGIAFGGGGTRGFAHIGALKAFEECGIEFSHIAGTSVGAIVASCYACGKKSSEIIDIIKKVRKKDIKNSKFFFISSNSANIEKLVHSAIGDKTFEEVNKPLAVVAVDLVSGDEIVLKNGPIAKAVSASCAVPGIFSPVRYGFYNLVDGGLANPIPSDVLRTMGAEVVVSIDLNSARGNGTNSTKLFDVLFATFRIAMKSTAIKGIINSNLMINPDLSKYKATSLDGMDDMIKIGYEATMTQMQNIKELLKVKK